MSCKNEQNDRPETIEKDDATATARREMGSACPCGGCPKKAKWVCLAGLAGALGWVAFRALRNFSPTPCGAR